jgi:hypothetical protein
VSGNLVGFVVIKDLQGELLLDHLYDTQCSGSRNRL